MKEFVLIFRNKSDQPPPSPEEMQQIMQAWMDWMGGLAAQSQLVSQGNRLSSADAKIVKPGNIVTDGPYTEIKEFISGFTIVRASSVENAAEIAKGCPIFKVGGNVEVREVIQMNQKVSADERELSFKN